jgi:hypothetical protein
MKKDYLTKSDFIIAESCPTKLYYKKLAYPSILEEDDYLKLLADGGYIVGKMARLLYPDGIEIKIDEGIEKAVEKTKELLKKESITLFEPIINIDGLFVKIDILVKKNNTFDLIEVKSKSFNSEEGKELFIRKKNDWKPYLEDVAYQSYVLSKEYPNTKINSFLMLPDKAKRTKIEGLASWFKLNKIGKSYDVQFTGNLEELRKDDILTCVQINEEVEKLLQTVDKNSKLYLESIFPEVKKIPTEISKDCKECEYKHKANIQRNGFAECWGNLAFTEPHIFDLYFMGTIGGFKNPIVNTLIKEGKVNIYDIPLNKLSGIRGERQRIQLSKTKANEEWVSDKMKSVLDKFQYPLYFIDFETSRMAIPYHKNMRPYEQVTFQWSVHKINSPGSEPEHFEWINLEESFPNFKFAKSLMNCIGEDGTVFMWATHENTTLRDIFEQMEIYKYEDPDLRKWLNELVKFSSDSPGRLVDMNDLTLKNYFHPEMKGKTSLKYVLPAIWKNNSYLHEIPWLKEYLKKEGTETLDPYETLQAIEIAGKAELVKEGTGAMRAYQELLYGINKDNPEAKQQWAKILLQYCKLDTMAMVIVWLHWKNQY